MSAGGGSVTPEPSVGPTSSACLEELLARGGGAVRQAGAFALDRLERQLGVPLTTRHVAYDYDVVLAMVSQGLGCALLPELAVYSGLVPDELSVVRLPGLGVRQLVVRHRSTRTEPGPATRAVLEALLAQAQGIELG